MTVSQQLDLFELNDAELDEDNQNGEDLFPFGRKIKIDIGDMDYMSWQTTLDNDLQTLDLLLYMINDIIPEHDTTLQAWIGYKEAKVGGESFKVKPEPAHRRTPH